VCSKEIITYVLFASFSVMTPCFCPLACKVVFTSEGADCAGRGWLQTIQPSQETSQETRHIPVLVLHRNEGAQSESLSMDYTVPLPTSKDFDFCIYMYLSPLIVRVNVYSIYIPTPNKKRKKIKQTLTQTKTQHKHKPEKQSGMCKESNEKKHDTLNRTVKPGVPQTQQALSHTQREYERACRTHAQNILTYIHNLLDQLHPVLAASPAPCQDLLRAGRSLAENPRSPDVTEHNH